MKSKSIISVAEQRVEKVYQETSKELKSRAIEIMIELRNNKRIFIKHLIMGMGSWAFTVEPFQIIYDDRSIGTGDNEDFNDLVTDEFRKIWKPVGFTKHDMELCKELYMILSYLTDKEYCTGFDWSY